MTNHVIDKSNKTIPACTECEGTGIQGRAPDGYFPCPNCSDENIHPDDYTDDRYNSHADYCSIEYTQNGLLH